MGGIRGKRSFRAVLMDVKMRMPIRVARLPYAGYVRFNRGGAVKPQLEAVAIHRADFAPAATIQHPCCRT
jgi:hypothetical protein